MLIRSAVPDDIPTLVDLGEYMKKESPRYRRYPYSREKVLNFTYNLMEADHGIVIVAEQNDVIIGMMLGFVTEFFFTDDAAFASDFVLYVVPEKRGSSAAARLVREFEARAHMLGADEVAPGTSTGVAKERTRKFYEGLDYNAVGHALVKVL